MSKTMDFKWKDEIEKPMNPFAEEDFRNAIADEEDRQADEGKPAADKGRCSVHRL